MAHTKTTWGGAVSMSLFYDLVWDIQTERYSNLQSLAYYSHDPHSGTANHSPNLSIPSSTSVVLISSGVYLWTLKLFYKHPKQNAASSFGNSNKTQYWKLARTFTRLDIHKLWDNRPSRRNFEDFLADSRWGVNDSFTKLVIISRVPFFFDLSFPTSTTDEQRSSSKMTLPLEVTNSNKNFSTKIEIMDGVPIIRMRYARFGDFLPQQWKQKPQQLPKRKKSLILSSHITYTKRLTVVLQNWLEQLQLREKATVSSGKQINFLGLKQTKS